MLWGRVDCLRRRSQWWIGSAHHGDRAVTVREHMLADRAEQYADETALAFSDHDDQGRGIQQESSPLAHCTRNPRPARKSAPAEHVSRHGRQWRHRGADDVRRWAHKAPRSDTGDGAASTTRAAILAFGA